MTAAERKLDELIVLRRDANLFALVQCALLIGILVALIVGLVQ